MKKFVRFNSSFFRKVIPAVVCLTVVTGCLLAWNTGSAVAQKAIPGLKVGTKAPSFDLKNQDGESISLESLLKSKKSVALVFYRSADW